MLGVERIGIIDIGSNSIRLVIYEQTVSKAYRVVDESKESARLSDCINSEGRLENKDIHVIVDILNHFKRLCDVNATTTIRAVATAAIRNAVNRTEILNKLYKLTGIPVEVLSGEEEAKFGFLGMINSIDIQDGLLIDIGGGSTEITLFRNRAIVYSHSFPFGAVNTFRKFVKNGAVQASDLASIQKMIQSSMGKIPWIYDQPNLSLIGLGGTIRNLCKIHQYRYDSSISLTHNYVMQRAEVNEIIAWLDSLSIEKRKKVEGLSSQRTDIIIPGLIILQTIFEQVKAKQYIVSGSGLRDGLLYAWMYPAQPQIDHVLEHSLHNLLSLYPFAFSRHVKHINTMALSIYDQLKKQSNWFPTGARTRVYLDVASRLYRMGVAVSYYNYHRHTYYLMTNSRLNGLTHREMIICALIASHKNKTQTRRRFKLHSDLLNASDYSLILMLGTLLKLAIAHDRSESQPIHDLSLSIESNKLFFNWTYTNEPVIERREIESLIKEFAKVWKLKIKLPN